RPGRGSSTDVLSENCQNRYQRREPRPPKSLGDPLYEPARIGPRAGRPAMNSFSGRPSHPKPEGRRRSQNRRARSATARFFGRVTVPSAVTSAAPGAWRILVLARSHGDGGIVSQRAKRAYARFARLRLTRWSGTMRIIVCG